jgi:hypothetical protein
MASVAQEEDLQSGWGIGGLKNAGIGWERGEQVVAEARREEDESHGEGSRVRGFVDVTVGHR